MFDFVGLVLVLRPDKLLLRFSANVGDPKPEALGQASEDVEAVFGGETNNRLRISFLVLELDDAADELQFD
jgi:hypothetical protein